MNETYLMKVTAGSEKPMLTVKAEIRGTLAVISIEGSLINEHMNKMIMLWDTLMRKKPAIIAFDCDLLTTIDSTAIGTIVRFLNETREKNIRLIFFDIDEPILHLIQTARLDRFIEITTGEKFRSEFNYG
jgi:anti-anti-sigma factor